MGMFLMPLTSTEKREESVDGGFFFPFLFSSPFRDSFLVKKRHGRSTL